MSDMHHNFSPPWFFSAQVRLPGATEAAAPAATVPSPEGTGVLPFQGSRTVKYSRNVTKSRISAVLTVAVFAAAMWFFEIVDFFLLGGLLDSQFGIRSWMVDDLWTVFTAPFMHAGLSHITANTVPLLVLGSLVAFSGLGRFLWASVIIAVVSGIGVWLLSPPGSLTVGASGLIFGYFGYLVLRGIIERRTADIVIMICTVLFYGGLIFGVLPQGQGISWQAHLFGFLGGLLAAYILPRRAKRQQLPPPQQGYGPYGPPSPPGY